MDFSFGNEKTRATQLSAALAVKCICKVLLYRHLELNEAHLDSNKQVHQLLLRHSSDC